MSALTCTDSTSSPSGENSCHDLQLVGGAFRVSSIMASLAVMARPLTMRENNGVHACAVDGAVTVVAPEAVRGATGSLDFAECATSFGVVNGRMDVTDNDTHDAPEGTRMPEISGAFVSFDLTVDGERYLTNGSIEYDYFREGEPGTAEQFSIVGAGGRFSVTPPGGTPFVVGDFGTRSLQVPGQSTADLAFRYQLSHAEQNASVNVVGSVRYADVQAGPGVLFSYGLPLDRLPMTPTGYERSFSDLSVPVTYSSNGDNWGLSGGLFSMQINPGFEQISGNVTDLVQMPRYFAGR